MARKTFLIKVVAHAISSHAMQAFMLPKGTLSRMDKRIRAFLQNFDMSQSHHFFPKAWDSICLPKAAGGMGIQKTRRVEYGTGLEIDLECL